MPDVTFDVVWQPVPYGLPRLGGAILYRPPTGSYSIGGSPYGRFDNFPPAWGGTPIGSPDVTGVSFTPRFIPQTTPINMPSTDIPTYDGTVSFPVVPEEWWGADILIFQRGYYNEYYPESDLNYHFAFTARVRCPSITPDTPLTSDHRDVEFTGDVSGGFSTGGSGEAINEGLPHTLHWTYGNGFTGTSNTGSPSPPGSTTYPFTHEYTYDTLGTVNPTVYVSDGYGRRSLSETVQIKPWADFEIDQEGGEVGPDEIELDEDFTLDASVKAYDLDGTIASNTNEEIDVGTFLSNATGPTPTSGYWWQVQITGGSLSRYFSGPVVSLTSSPADWWGSEGPFDVTLYVVDNDLLYSLVTRTISFTIGKISSLTAPDGVLYVAARNGTDVEVTRFVNGSDSREVISYIEDADTPSLVRLPSGAFHLMTRDAESKVFQIHRSDDGARTWAVV